MHDFWEPLENEKAMQSKSSVSTLLVIVVLIFTFPLWIALAAGLFGLMIGAVGTAVGIVAGVFGAVFGAIGGILGWTFSIPYGWHDWNILPVIVIIALVMLATRKR